MQRRKSRMELFHDWNCIQCVTVYESQGHGIIVETPIQSILVAPSKIIFRDIENDQRKKAYRRHQKKPFRIIITLEGIEKYSKQVQIRFTTLPSLFPPQKRKKKKKVKVGIHCIKSLRGLILDTEWMLAFAACFLSRERTRETTHQFSNAMNPICIPFPFRSAGR